MTTAWAKFFFWVFGMFLLHTLYYLIGYCVLYSKWLLDGCDDYMICTSNWFKQIFLDFRERLLYKDFILNDTKLILYLPWSSRKQPAVLVSSKSNVVFLNLVRSVCKTDPGVCVDLAFWKELFCTFSPIVSFSQCWAFCPLLCFGCWIEQLSAQYQRFVHSWQQFCHWIGVWKVYTDSPRVGSRNRKIHFFWQLFNVSS